MKIMAVDFGDARTGLAVCDPTEFLASPVGIIKEKNFLKAAQQIADAAKQHGAQMLVVGLPKNMDGTEGTRAQRCRSMGEKLQELTDLPVTMWDERRTTVSASAVLTQNGTFGKSAKSSWTLWPLLLFWKAIYSAERMRRKRMRTAKNNLPRLWRLSKTESLLPSNQTDSSRSD